MAKYELKRVKDGEWRIWARYQPFKGARTTSRVVTVGRTDIGKAVEESHAWVNAQRKNEA